MNLREIAKEAAVMGGLLRLWLMPYATYKVNAVNIAFAEIIPNSEWELQHHTFVSLEGLTVDVEADENAPPEAKAVAYYWQHRGADLGDNWKLFCSVIGGTAVEAFWEAYTYTRDGEFKPAEPLTANAEALEQADPELVGG